MSIDVTTPGLLFPAITLLLLAYTNRFLGLANLIRNLHSAYKANPDKTILSQIDNLRTRVLLIRNMQALGILSLLACVLCMFLLFAGRVELGKYVFGISLVLLMGSLVLSFREIQISIKALNLHLRDLENCDK